MKKKSGFTLIELIVCFALVTVLTISLFKTVLNIQQKQLKNISYNSFLSFVSVLNNTIQNDFTKEIITSVESCGTNCYDITYKDKGLTRLQVDRVNNTITYGSDVEELPKNYKFVKDISFNTYSSVTTGNYDSYYLLRLPIKSDLFPNLEDIKYMYEYNSNTIETNKYILNLDLNGGTLTGEYNNLLYPTGTVVNLPIPQKDGYEFSNWTNINENGSVISGNILTIGFQNVYLIANYIKTGAEFSFINNIERYEITDSGYYRLEVWGAEGGYASTNTYKGGYGGYSTGIKYIEAGTILYIGVGGKGTDGPNINTEYVGGYNGGGSGKANDYFAGGGGGATHIAIADGLLKNLSTDKVLIVAGGGGGASYYAALSSYGYGGNGGGYIGSSGTVSSAGYTQTVGIGGTQTSGSLFGQGASSTTGPGGGGGWYGGTASNTYRGSGGGSGYVGNLIEGITLPQDPKNGASETATPKLGKKGNGHAKISFVGNTYPNKTITNVGESETFSEPTSYAMDITVSGYYQLETWGAQGGYADTSTYKGGYGGYSTGIVQLEAGDTIYINVGGQGINNEFYMQGVAGGYNGGGNSRGGSGYGSGGGGGATHIAKIPGVLSSLSASQDQILIVAGGGGGASYYVEYASYGYGGNGGGYKGSSGTVSSAGYSQTVGIGGTQTSGAAFGQGANGTTGPGGGGGWYGGTTSNTYRGAGGGSGYIGNTLLISNENVTKHMVCNDCPESPEENLYTESVETSSETPTVDTPKQGDGYAKITLIST